MEHTLGVSWEVCGTMNCLNPYFNGTSFDCKFSHSLSKDVKKRKKNWAENTKKELEGLHSPIELRKETLHFPALQGRVFKIQKKCSRNFVEFCIPKP